VDGLQNGGRALPGGRAARRSNHPARGMTGKARSFKPHKKAFDFLGMETIEKYEKK
jgi:hypothetical protein